MVINGPERIELVAMGVMVVGLTCGAPAAAENDVGNGAVAVQPLIPEERWASQLLGTSVAIDGDRVVVGGALGRMIGAPANHSRGRSGVVFVFRRDGGGWVQEAKLTADDQPKKAYRFGHQVAISGDVIVVGGYLDVDTTKGTPGHAYVFRRGDAGWEIEAKLEPPDLGGASVFATSVAAEGGTIVLGAPNSHGGGPYPGFPTGTAFVYEWDGSSWKEQAMLSAAVDHAVPKRFGRSVAISKNRIVIGAPGANSRTGSAYVFERHDDEWIHAEVLTANDGKAGDRLGNSVSIDGDWIVLGARRDGDAGERAGAAYVYYRGEQGWFEQAKLTASDAAEYDQFGCSVSVSGPRIVVGAYGHDESGVSSGAAYVFELDGNNWLEKGRLAESAQSTDGRFGSAVAIDGETTVVGAPHSSVEGIRASGWASVFRVTDAQAYVTGEAPAEEPVAEADCGLELITKARALATKGDTNSALEHCLKAFATGCDDPYFFLTAARGVENSSMRRSAPRFARDRLKQDPDDIGAKVMLAALGRDVGIWEELIAGASSEWERVSYLSCASRTASRYGPYESARRFYEQLLAYYDTPAGAEAAASNLALVLFECAELLAERLSLPGRALPFAERAAKAYEDAPYAVDLVARILSRLGRHDEAIALHRQVVESEPERIIYRVRLAEAYARQGGHSAEATETLRAAYELALERDDGTAAREIEEVATELKIDLGDSRE